MKEKEKNPVLETTDQVMKNYEQALRSGLKVQEEIWQSWCAILNQSPLGSEWPKRFFGASGGGNGIVPAAQKRMEEAVALMEKNAKLGADLFKKAVDASQAPGLAESQSKWMDFMKASLEAGRMNVEATVEIASRTMGSFLSAVEKNSELVQQRVAKAA
jgi:hypothetical protein